MPASCRIGMPVMCTSIMSSGWWKMALSPIGIAALSTSHQQAKYCWSIQMSLTQENISQGIEILAQREWIDLLYPLAQVLLPFL